MRRAKGLGAAGGGIVCPTPAMAWLEQTLGTTSGCWDVTQGKAQWMENYGVQESRASDSLAVTSGWPQKAVRLPEAPQAQGLPSALAGSRLHTGSQATSAWF